MSYGDRQGLERKQGKVLLARTGDNTDSGRLAGLIADSLKRQ